MSETKTALITGGGKGIGEAIARTLGAAGINIAITYNSSASAAKLICAEITKKHRVKCNAYQLDLNELERIPDVVREIQQEFGHIDILINNAGITKDVPFNSIDLSDWERVMRVNATAPMLLMQAVLPKMKRNKSGTIINIASLIGQLGGKLQGSYGASKAALINLTKSAAKEFGRKKITINVISPGFIETDMSAEVIKAEKEDPRFAMISMVGPGLPQNVADEVLYLCQLKNSYVTGQVRQVCGGIL